MEHTYGAFKQTGHIYAPPQTMQTSVGERERKREGDEEKERALCSFIS